MLTVIWEKACGWLLIILVVLVMIGAFMVIMNAWQSVIESVSVQQSPTTQSVEVTKEGNGAESFKRLPSSGDGGLDP